MSNLEYPGARLLARIKSNQKGTNIINLFEQLIVAPTFARKSRQAIIAAGKRNWKDFNPLINRIRFK